MKTTLIGLITLASTLGILADTEIQRTSGTLLNPAAWSAGLPSLQNPGKIDKSGKWDVHEYLSGWKVTQTAGTIQRISSSPQAAILLNEGTEWILEKDGAIYTTARLRVGESKTAGHLTMNGGSVTASLSLDVQRNSTFRQNGGEIDAGTLRQGFAGKIFVKDGTAKFTGAELFGSNTQIEFSGGAWTFSGLFKISTTGTGTFIRFAEGAGSLTVDGLEISGSVFFDFVSGSGGSFTVKKYKQSDFEELWNKKFLRFNGANTGEFADIFSVTGDTLTLK
ncbi:MAG: hypothetical protein WC959_02020 [Kiritimatiellales bacterium]